ncbi:ribonuclease Z [Agathobacter sp.]
MIAIICTDNHYGILFNNRRLSHDRVLSQWIVDHTHNKPLWMREYSRELFDGIDGAINIKVSEDYLDKAANGEYCFVEDGNLALYEDRLEAILLCKWNRDYPSDTKLPKSLYGEDWSVSVIDEFRGNSHDKITIEKWCK